MGDSRFSLRQVLAKLALPVSLIIGITIIVALVELVGGGQTRITVTEMLIRMVVVIGIYAFVGNSGIVSFGHIGFMCLGAYVAAWAECDPDWKQLSLPGLPDFLLTQQYSFFTGLAGAEILVAVVALVFGVAILRLSGLAASIATFAFLALIYNVYSNWDSVTGAMTSLVGIPTVIGPWSALFFVAISIFAAYAFQISGIGLMLRASREDDIAAAASGVHVFRVRLIAFLISALIAGAGGYLYANFLGVVAVESFYVELTFLTLTMLVVGGLRSLTGAVIGVVVVTFVTEILRSAEDGVTVQGHDFSLPLGSQEIVLGVVMALMLILRPNGITEGREFSLAMLRGPWRRFFPARSPKPTTEVSRIDVL